MISKGTKNPRIRQRPSSCEGRFLGETQSAVLLALDSCCINRSPDESFVRVVNSRQRKSCPSLPLVRAQNYYFSKRSFFFLFTFGATILLSASAFDRFEVGSGGDFSRALPTINNNKDNITGASGNKHSRRERIFRHLQTLTENQRYDEIIETKATTEIYQIRPDSTKEHNNRNRLDQKSHRGETSLSSWRSVQLPEADFNSSPERNEIEPRKLQWIGGYPDLPAAFSKSNFHPNQHPSAFSNDLPDQLPPAFSNDLPNQHPSAFSNDRPSHKPSRSRRPSRRPTVQPTTQPTAQPTSSPTTKPTKKVEPPRTDPPAQEPMPVPEPPLPPITLPNGPPAQEPPAPEPPSQEPPTLEPPAPEPSAPVPLTLPPFSLPPFTLPPFTIPPTVGTEEPTRPLTRMPTRRPTASPTTQPTKPAPTRVPTNIIVDTIKPSPDPTSAPSPNPSPKPSPKPSQAPNFPEPGSPTAPEPGGGGGEPGGEPGGGGGGGGGNPIGEPGGNPIGEPGGNPIGEPGGNPIGEPGGGSESSVIPLERPSNQPSTSAPTEVVTVTETEEPTVTPSITPSESPTSTASPTVSSNGGNEPPEPGGGNEPPEPGGGNEPPEPGGGNEPPEPGGGNEPPEPGGGNEPPEPGGGNEPQEPGDGGNEPGNEPGNPGEGDTTEPPTFVPTFVTSTGAPTSTDVGDNEPGAPGDNGNEPGEPGSNGNEPGEPGGVDNEPGTPGGVDNEPGEPGGVGNEPAQSLSTTGEPGIISTPDESTEAPTSQSSYTTTLIPDSVFPPPPGEPATKRGIQPGEPGTISINQSGEAGGNEPGSMLIPQSREPGGEGEERATKPGTVLMAAEKPSETLPDIKGGYSPGSPEWNQERISIADVSPFALSFFVPAGKKKAQPSLDDTSVLEVLTSEYFLNYTKSVLGSNLLAVDGLVLQHVEVVGEVTLPSRRLSEFGKNVSLPTLANFTQPTSDLDQSFVFVFRSKFVFMHWTKIAWALDLPGLAKSLVEASLSENDGASYLKTIQGISSINNKDGKVEDFFFALAKHVELVEAPEVINVASTNAENKYSPFTKPKFPVFSVFAFVMLGLAVIAWIIRWRILKKKKLWLKKSDETCNIKDDGDETTLIFSNTADEGESDDEEQLQPINLHENLLWALDYIIYGNEEEEERHRQEFDQEYFSYVVETLRY